MARILVIDDDEPNREVVLANLASLGHDLDQADCGTQATRMLERNHFDIVITDVFMPDKDGLEMVLELKNNFPQTKIIAISGAIKDEHVDYLKTAERMGAHCSLSKPFDFTILVEKIDEMLKRD